MADQTERLSTSAQKGKRNLLFLGALALLLAVGCLKLKSAETPVGLFGIGVTASVSAVIVGLGLLIVYNLISFCLHAPFGDWLKEERRAYLMNPNDGFMTSARDLILHVQKVAGEDAIPFRVEQFDRLDNWLVQQVGERRTWTDNSKIRKQALSALWKSLPRMTKWKLTLHGLRVQKTRHLVLDDPLELWLPLTVGLIGFISVVVAGIRYW